MSDSRETPEALLEQGLACHRAGDLSGAARHYAAVLAARPGHPAALHLLGLVAYREGRLDEALQRVREALAREPDNPVFAANLGNIEKDAGDPAGAIASYRRALSIDPGQIGARNNLGTLLLAQGRLDDALACFVDVVARAPGHARAWHNASVVHAQQDRFDKALDAGRRAVALDPTFGEAWSALGRVLQAVGRHDEAVAALARCADLSPDSSEALADLAVAQHQAGKLAAALSSYERALALDRDALQLRCNLCALLQRVCDWERLARYWPAVAQAIAAGRAGVPLGLLVGQPGVSAADQLAAARANAAAAPLPARVGPLTATAAGGRCRVGYLSADFREHATSYLTVELFELHDRRAVELVLLSYGPDDMSAMRHRVAAAADLFVDLRADDDAKAADRIARLELDVLVDLNGNTDNARPGIAARRPAPVQVNWLGFPGTLGSPAYDYLLADRVVVPEGSDRWYAEQVVRLPGSYQSNDRRRARPGAAGSRADHGLPQDAVVLCCFNQPFKVTAAVMDLWLRVLSAVPSAVLWLLEDNPMATAALMRAAQAGGVDPGRLVFAPRRPVDAHLARYLHADLAVDTFPCTSHTTASDALWMGCPLVTLTGETFASRVAASLLHAAGLPELVCADLDTCERAIVRLAGDPASRRELRDRAGRAAASSPLFDTPAFTRALEAALGTMARRSREGLPPAAFDVPA